jgi:hypothetical protein
MARREADLERMRVENPLMYTVHMAMLRMSAQLARDLYGTGEAE